MRKSIMAWVAGVTLTVSPVLAEDVTGVVKYDGTPKKPRKVTGITDEHCKKQHPEGIEIVTEKVGKDGGLADVFVQVKSGLPKDAKYEIPKGEDGKPVPVVLDQKGCQYVPSVFGVMVGQPLLVRNSDNTNHNIHGLPKENPQFNFSQQRRGMENTIELAKPENFHIKCDVHPWMSARAFVMEHPFFAVTDEDGKFTIKNLPPGEYELEFWHSTAGTQTQKIKVEAGKPTKLEPVTLKPKPTRRPTPARSN